MVRGQLRRGPSEIHRSHFVLSGIWRGSISLSSVVYSSPGTKFAIIDLRQIRGRACVDGHQLRLNSAMSSGVFWKRSCAGTRRSGRFRIGAGLCCDAQMG